jgi:sugar O-acyltransferase (sialic acid O-acetyltransferase NeuD family)
MDTQVNSYIFGSGGFANEVLLLADDCDTKISAFVSLSPAGNSKIEEIQDDNFSPNEKFQAFIAVGSSEIRKKIYEDLRKRFQGNVIFPKLIHPTSRIMGLKSDSFVGEGSIICANCVLTSNIKLGSFSQINLQSTIGHDTEIGDFFTASPGVNISGSCKIQDSVYFGTNSCVREKIHIAANVTVGCGAAVVSNINEPGIYAGVPARRIKNG